MCLGCDGVVCSCGTSVGLVGRRIGGGTGEEGGGVCGWVVRLCLCSVAFFGWRVGGRYLLCVCLFHVVSVACLVCM